MNTINDDYRFGGPIAIHFCSKPWPDGKAGPGRVCELLEWSQVRLVSLRSELRGSASAIVIIQVPLFRVYSLAKGVPAPLPLYRL
jgi:hypothetical protein